ncbi:toxin co-regulated pilus biosynthesis Q family protein [Candidatus Williamhamiltonella defendens]|uniref:Pilus assembly protein PilL n=2 Tax=Candidatus Williamhamiltonella defendens TaxID=138072 RepID=A0A249DZG7_9ENTR|nr:toxin co-regulated pilus biosynthesis Q family protein [Candidatus Hamiltonella defensa]ASX26943.1 pilus assembly protein PilL [Candidatus Hamiltonella defensa (Bemisia tabaci)]
MKLNLLLFFFLCLSGCTGSPSRHEHKAPMPLIESQIHLHSKKIALAQQRLQQASEIRDFATKNKVKPNMSHHKKKGQASQRSLFNKTVKLTVQKRDSMPKTPIQTEKNWRAQKGSTLKETLYLWVEQEKCLHEKNRTWSLIWDTDTNYRIDAHLSFSGTFRDALNGIFRLYARATVPLFAGINTTQCLLKVDDQERHS